jgi:enterochelin esterase-like enzyme
MQSTALELVLLLLPAAAVGAQDAPRSPLAGYQVDKKTLTSQALGEDRPYLVAVPDSYAQAPDRRYPVIYVLDGPGQGGHTARTAAQLAAEGVMPEVMLVAIPNLSDDAGPRPHAAGAAPGPRETGQPSRPWRCLPHLPARRADPEGGA